MSRRRRRARVALAAVASAGLVAGCVPTRGGWDVAALERRHPPLGDRAHRLGDLAPHGLPVPGELVLFLCHWPTGSPIPVVLPADATEAERAMLRRVLRAWAEADLGVRFEERDPGPRVGLHFRFVQQGDPGPLPSGAGDTLTDCRIDDPRVRGDRLDAALVYASVHLRRDAVDWVGGTRPLDEDERTGAALHEVGHALGFASHVAAGRSIMSASPEIARHAGAALRAGEWHGDPHLAALYAVPSGTVVGRARLDGEAARTFARFVAAAEAAGLDGPYSRVGDRSARVFFVGTVGGPVAGEATASGEAPAGAGRIVSRPALRLRPWPAADPRGGSIEPVPNAAGQRLLEAAAPDTPAD